MHKYNLPKSYLSYSAAMLFLKDKQAYRDRYYLNKPGFTSIFTVFGKGFAERLERNDPTLAHIEKYSKPEYDIKCEIDGVPIRGFIDSYDPEKKAFLEYKTSITDMWCEESVKKHLQLDFYSMVIEYLFGEVQEECKLIWIGTQWKNNIIEYRGHKFQGAKELELTGQVEVFPRVVTKEERLAVRQLFAKIAQEISDDYTAWLSQNKELSPTPILTIG